MLVIGQNNHGLDSIWSVLAGVMNDAHRFSPGSVKSFQRLSWSLSVKKFLIAKGGMRFAFPPYRYFNI